jgi:hypothetical protein
MTSDPADHPLLRARLEWEAANPRPEKCPKHPVFGDDYNVAGIRRCRICHYPLGVLRAAERHQGVVVPSDAVTGPCVLEHSHAHEWRPTGHIDTGHQPPRRLWECNCGERTWAHGDDEPPLTP